MIPALLMAVAPAAAQNMDDGEAQSSKFIQAVDEYRPAPGQFVNTMPEYEVGDTQEDMARKCTELLADGERRLVTLGAYGGYIVFHFYHPIANVDGKKDFAVWGNAFANNAEPAVVMVAVDANGNGRPDDEWYELRGSEYDNPLTRHNYSLTYSYRQMSDIPWADNEGAEGVIARNEYHEQDYFPQWLCAEGSLTFHGVRLPDNASWNGSQFLLPAYAYGYADNQPNLLSDNATPNTDGCGFDIGWAVDANGQHVALSHIDFVKVYNAMNQQCGWIGETSTEISGAEDLHLEASLETARKNAAGIRTISQSDDSANSKSDHCYDLSGRRIAKLEHGKIHQGIYIHQGKKAYMR